MSTTLFIEPSPPVVRRDVSVHGWMRARPFHYGAGFQGNNTLLKATTMISGIIGALLVLSSCLATIIDLTHTYGTDVLYPPVGPNGADGLFNFTIMHRGYEPSLDAWLEINWIGLFEHGSTHIDAPAHYSQGRAHIDAVPVEQLMGPGVMIDMTSATDPDYLMTIDDIKNWEKEHGLIPRGAIVMMNTGKHKLYPNRKLFYGTETPDNTSTLHNQGLDPAAAKWLMHNRQIKAFGTDAHSCDPGQNNNRNRCHEQFLPNGVLLLEFVANLDRLPPTGATIFLGPIKMRDGSGGPCRILAFYGDDKIDPTSGATTPLYAVSLLLSLMSMFLSL